MLTSGSTRARPPGPGTSITHQVTWPPARHAGANTTDAVDAPAGDRSVDGIGGVGPGVPGWWPGDLVRDRRARTRRPSPRGAAGQHRPDPPGRADRPGRGDGRRRPSTRLPHLRTG